MAVQIQIRRDSAANWASYNPTLASGELGYDTTNELVKVGDGSTAWVDLNPMPVSLDSLVAGAGLQVDLLPGADLTYDLGSQTLRFVDIHGDLDGGVTIYAKVAEVGGVSRGDVVYISGTEGGGSEVPEISLANASDPDKMPAFGLVRDAAADNEYTHVVTLGSLTGLSITGNINVGDVVYVSASTPGAFTATKPSGEDNLVENIGYVVRKGGSNGILRVGGAGRTNAVPNLNEGHIFIGDASDNPISAALSTVVPPPPNLTITADAGTDIVYPTTSTIDIQGGAKLTTTSNSLGFVTVNHDLPAGGTTYYFPTSLQVDSTGHVSGVVTTAKEALNPDLNLSDVTDAATARVNLDVPSILESDTWKTVPQDGQVIKLFDDMLGATGRNSRTNAPFYGLGTSSSYWQDAYGYSPGGTGVIRALTTANANARATVNGVQIYDWAEPDGTEWLFEGRFYFDFNAAATNTGVTFGAFCPKTEHTDSTTEQGAGYGNTAKAGVSWRKSDTYWKSYYYDVEGVNNNPTEADLTSFTGAEDTWVTVATHAYKDTIFSVSTWVIKSYINGTLVATQYLTSGTEAPVFYCNLYNGGEALANSMYVDWLMFQYTRPSAVTHLNIEDL
jgi:hypothetical protein